MNAPDQWLDATAQAELVARGDVSPVELVDAAIARIEALNPALNAVIHERYDRARGNLDRHGVHFLTAYVAGV